MLPPQINMPRDWPIEEYKDIEGLGYYAEVAKTTRNDPAALAEVVRNLSVLGRDNARTPMQWDASPHAGFTDAPAGPWMRVNDSYTEINVERQLDEPGSVLNFWRDMIKFRKRYADLLIYGAFEVLDLENEKTFVFVKRHGDSKALVALNFSGEPSEIEVPSGGHYTLRVGNYGDKSHESGEQVAGGLRVVLRPWEAHLYIHNDTSS